MGTHFARSAREKRHGFLTKILGAWPVMVSVTSVVQCATALTAVFLLIEPKRFGLQLVQPSRKCPFTFAVPPAAVQVALTVSHAAMVSTTYSLAAEISWAIKGGGLRQLLFAALSKSAETVMLHTNPKGQRGAAKTLADASG